MTILFVVKSKFIWCSCFFWYRMGEELLLETCLGLEPGLSVGSKDEHWIWVGSLLGTEFVKRLGTISGSSLSSRLGILSRLTIDSEFALLKIIMIFTFKFKSMNEDTLKTFGSISGKIVWIISVFASIHKLGLIVESSHEQNSG